MTKLPLTVATLVAVALGLVCLPTSSSAQKALVYCPPVDATGCDNIVAALAATGGPFPGGVDRGYDGNGGTVSLAGADLSQYTAFVVPSLADDSASAPYALLRDATIASRLNAALGKVVLWSGTPDMGSANGALKEALLRNLAGLAGTGGAAPRTLGLVALQDFSDDEAHRYGWVTALTGHSIGADSVLQVESSVQTMTGTGATILDNAGTPLTYDNLTSFGFSATDGWVVDAKGTSGGEPVLVTTTAVGTGGSTLTAATVTTDKPDYPPFDTVTISGTGWQSGETVSLSFHETPQNHPDRTLTTVADASGNIRDRDYSTDDMSLNVSIALTATGQSSGRTATVTFTDGPCVGTVAVGPQNPTPVAASGAGAGAATATFPVTVSRKNGCGTGSGGTPFSVTLSATGFPATGSLSPSTLAFLASDNSKSATLTVTVPATVAPKAYNVTVTATNTTASNDNSNASDSLRVTGGVGSVAVGAQSPSPLPAGHSATFTVTVNRGSSTGNFTASLASSGLPAGATGAFSPTSVSFTSSAQTSQTSTLTITSLATLAAGNYSFTVSATNPLIPADAGSASASLVTSSPATKLAFSTAAFTVRVGLCSPKITIASQNPSGVATNPASSRTITLSTTSTTSPGGQFFSDPACGSAITSVAIPTTANSADFYYEDGSAGGPTLTVTDNDVASPLTSATQKETISPLPATTTVVTSSGSPSTFGQEVTFTATVSPTSGPGTPTGTVQFSIDGTASGSPVALVSGVATLKISTLSASANKHPVAAAYSGDANFASSSGQTPNNQQMVNPANTATTVASSKNPSNPGESVTFSATVIPQAPGGGTPTGTVQLKIDGTNSGSAVALAAGAASFPASVLNTTGTHVITVVYANLDGNYNTSTGTLAGGQVVQQTPTTLTVVAATGTFGGTTNLSATLSTSGGPLAGQSVSFTLNGNSAGSATTNASGVATVNNVSLAGINAGTYATGVGASFTGGGAFAGSTGSNSLTVGKASQTITFNTTSLEAKKFGDPNFSVASFATASSALPVSFSSAPGGACSVTSAGDVTIVAAGACTITASQAGNTNFQAAPDVPSIITIGKAAATLAIDPATLQGTYNGAAHVVTVTTAPVAGLTVVSITYAGSATAPVDAGSYAVVATLTNANYDASVPATGTLVIDKATPTIAWATPANIIFGTALGSTQLNATATGVGGTSLAGAFTYTPDAGVKLDAGTHTLSVSFAPTDSKNYNSVPATTVSLTVLKASQTIAFDASGLTKKFGDPSFSVASLATASSALAVTFSSTTTATCGVTSGGDVSIAGAGVCTITASQAGNTNFDAAPDVSSSFTIAKGVATLAIDPATLHGTYNGSAHAVTVSTTPVGLSGVSITYAGSATAPVDAGSYAVVASLTNPNYDAPDATGTLVIDKATPTVAWATPAAIVYLSPLGSAQLDATATGVGGASLGGTFTYTPAAGEVLHAGSHTLSVSFAPTDSKNYNSVPATTVQLIVLKADQTIAFSSLAKKTYGDAPFTLGATASSNLAVTYATASPCAVYGATLTIKGAGTCTITASQAGDGDYNKAPDVSQQQLIDKAPLTITAENAEKVYGAALPPFSVKPTAFVNGDTYASLTTPVSLHTTASAGSPVVAGGYPIIASGATSDNYEITFVNGTLTITPAPLTITADDKQKVYGDPLPTFTVKPAAFVNGDTYASLGGTLDFDTPATQASSVAGGPYPITPKGLTSTNYAITFASGSLTVTPAPLMITAEDKQKVYGDPLPPFTVKYESFVNGDTYSSLGGTLGFDTPATSGSSVVGSPYPVTPKGLTSTNYTITFAAGKLTVTPAPLTVAADDKQKVYGAALPPFTVKPAAFVNGDTYASLGGTLAFQTTASQTSTVAGSPYSITPSGLTSTNYTIAFVAGRLAVTPAPLTVTALNKQKVFDGSPYPFTSSDVTYSAFVLGENPSVLGGTLSFSQGATIQVGSYSNAPQGLISTNYAITFVPGQLTIQAWTLAGYYQPVDMSTGGMVYNTVKGGSTVPLKFNIFQATQANTNERTDVAAVKSFSATPYVCTSSATDEIEIVTTGGTILRYDVTGQQFIQNWLTPKSPGTCYQVTMTALDGSKLTAFFKLK